VQLACKEQDLEFVEWVILRHIRLTRPFGFCFDEKFVIFKIFYMFFHAIRGVLLNFLLKKDAPFFLKKNFEAEIRCKK